MPVRDVLLPLYEGRMIGQFDFSKKGWVSGKGRTAVWRDIPWEAKVIEPQFLMREADYTVANAVQRGLKLGFMDVSSATNTRTTIAAVTYDAPHGNKVPVLSVSAPTVSAEALAGVLGTFAYDFSMRARLGGLTLNYFIVEETPLPVTPTAGALGAGALRLAAPHPRFAPCWLDQRQSDSRWKSRWAITPHDRLRLRSVLDALVAALYGLSRDDLRWILRDCDHPVVQVCSKPFARTLDPKGFWRVDKTHDPELRHTVLTLVAFDALEKHIAEQGGDRDAGIVAVLVYPMNALAEDQLDRLRGLLAGRGIPFGMYVGKTAEADAGVRGERMPAGSSNSDYHARLKQMREAGESSTLLPHEERGSRASMRKDGGQPRILLTNVKQLELLLTRGKDIGLFANAPLEFLVFDEAHTFRGAQGAETACLIRRLRSFCGKEAGEVTCVATSATMADPERGPDAAADFARRFFGVDAANVRIVGEVYDELRWNERRATPAGPPEDAPGLLRRLLAAVDAPDSEVADALSGCLVELGGARLPKTGWQAALASQLATNELVYQLAELLRTPRALDELPAALRDAAGREVSEHEVLCWLALGVACGRGGHDPLLRPVVHSFIRGVGGAVVTLSNPGGTARFWLAGEEADTALDQTWHRFPLLTCTTCGQHYYETSVKDFKLVAGKRAAPEGGDLVGTTRVWEHLARELGGDRVLIVDRLVVQPDEDDVTDTLDEDGNLEAEDSALPAGHDYEHRRLFPLFVCGRCGGLHGSDGTASAACHGNGTLRAVQVVRNKPDLPGVLHSCVACQSPGRRPGGGRYREPARPVRAVSVSDVHVLAHAQACACHRAYRASRAGAAQFGRPSAAARGSPGAVLSHHAQDLLVHAGRGGSGEGA